MWLYSFTEAYYHAFRVHRKPSGTRLLDAGCGTGHGVVQIRYQAPGAEVHAFDFSARSIEIAQKRIDAMGGESVVFHELDILDLSTLPGQFDAIFCSGVVHHTANPVRALQQLKSKLKPDGVLYLMLYSEFGRRPSILMQQAIKLLCKDPSDQMEGLRLGRLIFDGLPPANPIATWERERWSDNHRKHAEAFIDMYVNANERDYTIAEVFRDLEAAGLKFLRFTNPQMWSLATRMNAHPELLVRFESLSPLAQYEVIEHLFPRLDQYEFFVAHEDSPVKPPAWAVDGSLAERADKLTAVRSPFVEQNPTPQQSHGLVFLSGYFGQIASLDAVTVDLFSRCDGRKSVKQTVEAWETDQGSGVRGKGMKAILKMERDGLVYFADLA